MVHFLSQRILSPCFQGWLWLIHYFFRCLVRFSLHSVTNTVPEVTMVLQGGFAHFYPESLCICFTVATHFPSVWILHPPPHFYLHLMQVGSPGSAEPALGRRISSCFVIPDNWCFYKNDYKGHLGLGKAGSPHWPLTLYDTDLLFLCSQFLLEIETIFN